jgi:hypothetical protein
MTDADVSAVLDRLAEAARTHHGSPQLRARLADVVYPPLRELKRLKTIPHCGRPRGAFMEALMRMAGRPQGVTAQELREATGSTADRAAHRLNEKARLGTLHRVRLAGRRVRYFATFELAETFRTRLEAADAEPRARPQRVDSASDYDGSAVAGAAAHNRAWHHRGER